MPEKTYSETISRLQGMANTLADWSKPGVALNRVWIEAYRSNREQVLRRADVLSKELAVQRQYQEATKKRLEGEMKQWFTGGCNASQTNMSFGTKPSLQAQTSQR